MNKVFPFDMASCINSCYVSENEEFNTYLTSLIGCQTFIEEPEPEYAIFS